MEEQHSDPKLNRDPLQKTNPDSGFEAPASTRNAVATGCDKW
jgi:hypothetical protein